MAVSMNYREQNYKEMSERLGNKNRVKAWNSNTNRQANNTYLVRETDDSIVIEFQGVNIARFWEDGTIAFSNCGWSTSTTKHRLNGIMGLSVWQHKHVWYFASNKAFENPSNGYEFGAVNVIFPDGSVQVLSYSDSDPYRYRSNLL